MKLKITYDARHRPTYWIENKKVSKRAFYKASKPSSLEGTFYGPALKGWPIVSDALAVHPSLRQEAMESAAKKGVPTEVNEKGQIILRDRAHRREYLKAYTFHDRDGGYGDG